MKLYKVINTLTGEETNRWTDDSGLDANHYEPSMGKPAWTETVITAPEVRNDKGEIITPAVTEEISRPAEYQIVEEDLSAEIAEKEVMEQEKETLKTEVKQLLKKTTTLTTAELTKIIKLLTHDLGD